MVTAGTYGLPVWRVGQQLLDSGYGSAGAPPLSCLAQLLLRGVLDEQAEMAAVEAASQLCLQVARQGGGNMVMSGGFSSSGRGGLGTEPPMRVAAFLAEGLQPDGATSTGGTGAGGEEGFRGLVGEAEANVVLLLLGLLPWVCVRRQCEEQQEHVQLLL